MKVYELMTALAEYRGGKEVVVLIGKDTRCGFSFVTPDDGTDFLAIRIPELPPEDKDQ